MKDIKASTMMKVEKARPATEMDRAYFGLDGKFYRAYGWSAWLAVYLVESYKSAHPEYNCRSLKPSKKSFKGGKEFVFVGFPVESMDKFLAGAKSIINLGGGRIDVIVDIPPATIQKEFPALSQWESQTEYSAYPDAKEYEDGTPVYGNYTINTKSITSIGEIIEEISKCPLENMTPMDAINFLNELRKAVLAIEKKKKR